MGTLTCASGGGCPRPGGVSVHFGPPSAQAEGPHCWEVPTTKPLCSRASFPLAREACNPSRQSAIALFAERSLWTTTSIFRPGGAGRATLCCGPSQCLFLCLAGGQGCARNRCLSAPSSMPAAWVEAAQAAQAAATPRRHYGSCCAAAAANVTLRPQTRHALPALRGAAIGHTA